MSFITYKQADSRWGKKNYNGSSSMATAGCGPTSCAMIAYGVDGKTTPLDTMKYMQSHGYAIRNNGTAWNGIPACLKAFGVKDVQEVPNMTKCWELMSKGYVGVFLFRSGSRGGVTWTSSGHYIAVTDYKYQNGKHYVYTRDSGGRNHTGFFAYETTGGTNTISRMLNSSYSSCISALVRFVILISFTLSPYPSISATLFDIPQL